ncbi:MAG: hypothetical protein ACYTFG_10800 [Planctomycetota bacterium]|jgi:hypothetical protein
MAKPKPDVDHTYDHFRIRYGDHDTTVAPNFTMKMPVNGTIAGARYGDIEEILHIAVKMGDTLLFRDGEILLNGRTVYRAEG